jgi:hypothetical protein
MDLHGATKFPNSDLGMHISLFIFKLFTLVPRPRILDSNRALSINICATNTT